MHEPHPWVVGTEPDDRPAVHRHSHRVPLRWVFEVELLGVLLRVEVAKSLGKDIEVIAVEVDGVVLWRDDARVLQDNLHHGVIPKLV